MFVSRFGKIVTALTFLAVITFCTNSALAGESTVGMDTFRLNVGGFLPAIDSELRITSKNLDMGTIIDLEDDLGFDEDVTLAQISGYWRFAKKHRLFAGYYAFDRDASKSITKEIYVNDKRFAAGATLASNWEIDFIQASYAYSFLQSEKWELSASLGLYYLDTTITLSGNASVSIGEDEWSGTIQVTEEESIGLPIPLLGLVAEYHITPKWRTRMGARYFTLSFDDWSGHMLEATAALEFLFHKNFGIGTGYTYLDVEVERDRESKISDLTYIYGGVQIYGIWYF